MRARRKPSPPPKVVKTLSHVIWNELLAGIVILAVAVGWMVLLIIRLSPGKSNQARDAWHLARESRVASRGIPFIFRLGLEQRR